MDQRSEPIEMPSRERRSPATKVGERWGHELGTWIHRVGEWRTLAEEQLHRLQHFWDEIQQPEGRKRHVIPLMAIAAGVGFLVGVAIRRSRS